MYISIDMNIYLVLVACLVTSVRAAWWDDFTNNLATDLTPLISLFGEKASTQFLSESTTILDNFLFAMAPLGILTGVVSAIRVCGGPSLRAFIGRAQEGGGVAEAELCSSTSRDVCELYHNGAIIRAFGRPKILEVKSTFGMFSSQEYFQKHYKKDWDEYLGQTTRGDEEEANNAQPIETTKDTFAPNPNLSLNIGITKRSKYVHWGAAVTGFLAQVSVLLFGAVVQYRLHWMKDENPIEPWAFPFTLGGTICVCGGMFFCAFLVNDSTKERKFQRKKGKQTFDPFLFSSSNELPWTDYITSWKKSTVQASKVNHELGRPSWVGRLTLKPSSEIWTLVATSVTMVGFVLQFVGLRSMHSAVSLLQLGVTLGMGVVRALLRTQRLKIEQNLLRDRPDEVSGHELDWLALQIGEEPNRPSKLAQKRQTRERRQVLREAPSGPSRSTTIVLGLQGSRSNWRIRNPRHPTLGTMA
ncbi:hypothetical protein F4820DRAFT_458239 [Hypoxylon rubiginosum]|uniref:Uncharacterized protein n=1 Tax=Hypoxylon rubiginosum TaxID=110542 RepID=A0ACB9Z2J2_9PEZI|nr:hypothetical protein F4820DRAFT_458239 [Hypoxylon rubiginosum]